MNNNVLADCLAALRERESELRAQGVLHAGIFGSVARGEVVPSVDFEVFPTSEVLRALIPASKPGVLIALSVRFFDSGGEVGGFTWRGDGGGQSVSAASVR